MSRDETQQTLSGKSCETKTASSTGTLHRTTGRARQSILLAFKVVEQSRSANLLVIAVYLHSIRLILRLAQSIIYLQYLDLILCLEGVSIARPWTRYYTSNPSTRVWGIASDGQLSHSGETSARQDQQAPTTTPRRGAKTGPDGGTARRSRPLPSLSSSAHHPLLHTQA